MALLLWLKERNVMEQGIQLTLFEYFSDTESFSLKDAEDAVLNVFEKNVKIPSIRARIYEGIDKGLFTRLAKGVYTVSKNDCTCLLINGDGRDLSFIKDDSIDFIITDHPYDLKSNKGGNRNFADYSCFQYTVEDFKEKNRVLKPGCYLVEFLPDKNEENRAYLNQIEEMAISSGFRFYAQVPWVKGSFIANTGRKVKNREIVVFFSKGKARSLRRDKKKDLQDTENEHYMSGTSKMLPAQFVFQPPSKQERIHQAEKPVELLEEIIELVSVDEDVGLDQFAGSAASGVAAYNKKRNMILIESDKETYEKGKERLSKLEERQS